MNVIHKIAAVVIQDNGFLMVRKVGKDIWTSLGGKPEGNETEEQALIREIKEELDCDCTVKKKLGEFQSRAVFDDAVVRLSTYLVELKGTPKISDPELEEFKFINWDYNSKGIKLPDIIEEQVIPICVKEGLLNWKM
jgi:8-oxo-dGTP diphosphatase